MIQELKYRLVQSDVMKIFVTSTSLYLFVAIIKLYFALNGDGNAWFNSNLLPYMAIAPKMYEPLYKPWTILTHFFLESSIMSLISNMLWLWFFGFIIEDLKGKNSMWPLFVTSGLVTGLVIWLLTAFTSGSLSSMHYTMELPLISVAVAAVLFNPQFRVFTMIGNGLPLYAMGIIFLLLRGASLNFREFAPIIGFIVAVSIGVLYNYGGKTFFNNLQYKINKGEFLPILNFKRNTPKRDKVEGASNFKVIDITEHKMNELLDKINANGIDSLTSQDRKWLEQFGKN